MDDLKNNGSSEEKTYVKDISWCGVVYGCGSSCVDVKDGKIIRIRPLHYDWKYTKEEIKPWVMKARGKTFEPKMQLDLPPLSIAYKKRVYSPARIRYPMLRVDFDPKGERNIQNRGVSKYKRISWDEALDLITSEILRIKEKYGTTAILYECDQHGEN
ncbi:MAG TPA: molybdopterin-dependent oxidoreductase, partial [Thermoleophilia bacterium]|nr:molybdopterin-dependent oxidoreductase [Thermoleophilia bacterium]